MRPDVTPEIEVAINALIRRETACLNDGDLDAWMALFTDDGYYWMPLEADQQSPDEHDSLIYDNRPLMEILDEEGASWRTWRSTPPRRTSTWSGRRSSR